MTQPSAAIAPVVARAASGHWGLLWGAPAWLPVAAGVAILFAILLLWGYRSVPVTRGTRVLCAAMKAVAIVLLAVCLADPLFSSERARPGANGFVLLADTSASMGLKDASGKSRGDALKSLAGSSAPWLEQLGRDFELRQFSFDTRLTSAEGMDALAFTGAASNLGAAIDKVTAQYAGRPLAGILLMTDGNATDMAAVERLLAKAANVGPKGERTLPPIYPVLLGADASPKDIAVGRLAVSQTGFEDAPVTITAEVTASGYKGQHLAVELVDENGKVAQRQIITADADGAPIPVRYLVKPEQAGLAFFTVRAGPDEGAAPVSDYLATGDKTGEATLANNAQSAAVDRPKGPFRVLYVAGRPSWEYKFLQRAVSTDEQVQLTGLIRVAKREPKFAFLGQPGERSNPLFQAFNPDDPNNDTQYDAPVMERLNTADENELRAGFPKTAEELFQFRAIILDDVESQFFTQDQLALLKEFVRTRGGGLLMLGSEESFHSGQYDKTPVGDVLPVYADAAPQLPADTDYHLKLTTEGWLEPWVRLRPDEASERERLSAMPTFDLVNTVRGIKPGATVLARAVTDTGADVPALVEQRYGRGRAAALLIGDMWHWQMRRADPAQTDAEKAWRQMVRWLVADVPGRVEIAVDPRHNAEDAEGAIRLAVSVRDEKFAPVDGAVVTVTVTGPDGKSVKLPADPAAAQNGEGGKYEAAFVPQAKGNYRAEAAAVDTAGKDVGAARTGFVSDPAADEFASLRPNRDLLERLARATGGETIAAADVPAFAKALPTKHAEIMEPFTQPLWHESWVFLAAILLLAGEWGLRRYRGLA